jgi:hypothetical protein
MANKLTPKNWNDVQVAIATVSMVTTLACWNMFAGPDRASALERAQDQASSDPSTSNAVTTASVSPQVGKVYFGGAEPQQVVVVIKQQRRGGGGGGGDNSGGGNSGGGGGSVAVADPGAGGGGGGGAVSAPAPAPGGGGGGGGTGGS